MPKLRLLLLDAVVVIYLHELGLWEEVIAQCDVHLSREVVGEAHFFLDPNGDRRSIDLNQYERSHQITVHDVSLADTAPLRSLFGRDMLEKMDAGKRNYWPCCTTRLTSINCVPPTASSTVSWAP